MKKGKLISLSGVDGSGKTTQAKILYSTLTRKRFSVIKVQTFEYLILKPITNIFKRNGSFKQIPKYYSTNTNPILRLWFVPAFIDMWIIYLTKIIPITFKYDIVISDRYFTDMAVSIASLGYMPRRFFELYIKFLPRANKQILLLLDPKTSLERSKEYDLKYHSAQNQLYRVVSKTINSHQINAKLGKGAISQQIITCVKNI